MATKGVINEKSSDDFAIKIKDWTVKVAGQKISKVSEDFATLLLQEIEDRIPIGTLETSSVYPGYAMSTWKKVKKGPYMWAVLSNRDDGGYNYNWVLEFGGNPWTRQPDGTENLTAEGFSRQAPTGFLRTSYREAYAKLMSGFSRIK